MLLVPIQGEQWQGGLSFPTPAIVTARFPIWFPHLPAKTLAAVERLYAGGSYTQVREDSNPDPSSNPDPNPNPDP